MLFRIKRTVFLNGLLLVIAALLLTSCGKDNSRIDIGVIAPSTNWLPLALGLQQEIVSAENLNIHYFSSGWEVNEAISAGRIDIAIMPFTYIWKNVSEGKDVRIISFFERESDGIITRSDITELSQLDGKKIGVLRASTLDIFVHIIAEKYEFQPEIVYFRSPTEMAAALEQNLVAGLSFYVPQIFRISEGFQPLYWYGEDYYNHPCCDIAATQSAIDNKRSGIIQFMKELNSAVSYLEDNPRQAINTMMSQFSLTQEEAEQTLKYTGFAVSLDEQGQNFEMKAAEKMKELGYLRRLPAAEEVFYYDIIKDISQKIE